VTPPKQSLIVPRPAHILVVDDDPEVLSAVRRVLRVSEPDWLVTTASSGRRALDVMTTDRIDVVVTDLHMPEMDGYELLRHLEKSYPETIRIVHSSHTATLATELLRYLAHNVVAKPADPADILALVRWAVRASGAIRRHA